MHGGGVLLFAYWVILYAFLSSADFFFQNQVLRKILSGIQSVLNSLDPDQARQNVGPDLGPKCLQRLSADDTSMHGGRVSTISLLSPDISTVTYSVDPDQPAFRKKPADQDLHCFP